MKGVTIMSALVKVGTLSRGAQFRTGASGRVGKVIDTSYCLEPAEVGVLVRLLGPKREKDLHPNVLVEVIH